MKSLFSLIVLSILSLIYIPVFAGIPAVVGQVGYGPVTATPIPTLSGTMLIVLSLLIATFGYRVMRQKDNNANRIMILSLIGVGTLTFGLTGVKIMHDAQAVGYLSTTHPLVTTSGSANIHEYHLNFYKNDTGTNIQINSIVIDPGKCMDAQPDDPVIAECAAGTTTLANGDQCRVACVSPF